ncbi:MAG: 4-hydroxy-3-methylbut-2-enyl diphosphate reductase [Alphaproteobacteria bacterium]|nr:4-hydroxy-3-methylbut-2-enyl diphosphate reductase [Alphaproteobacteria bacterium]
MSKPSLTVLLAAPRGFCAGVDRAIRIVEIALEKYGAPVYVRHEIVHNRHVVESLERKGAVFVEELAEVSPDVPVVFSAHGVAQSVFAEAEARKMFYLDATCPLVTKVHVDAQRHHRQGRTVILIGHAGHPEVVGTMGQLPEGAVILVENVEQAERLALPADGNPAFVTQTTLSVDDTAAIVAVLRRRFPAIAAPRTEDICYATTNRQAAVKAIATECDALIVIGAPYSSNSRRLAEVAEQTGCAKAILIQHAGELDPGWLDGVRTLGLTAGASAPEILVKDLIAALEARFDVAVREVDVTKEDMTFSLPRVLTA